MPDFTARITTAGDVKVFVDTTAAKPYCRGGDAPSRLNARPGLPHRYLRFYPGDTIAFAATVGGVEGPLDAALGGRLFAITWAEWTGTYPLSITSPAGQSSVGSVVIPTGSGWWGHHAVCFRRPEGGSVVVSFEVEPGI